MLKLGGAWESGATLSEYHEQNESEIVVSIFRALMIILVVVTPRFALYSHTVPQAMGTDAYVLIILAAVYNLLTALTYLRQIDLPFRRQTMIMMDLCFVTVWISISMGEKRDLFPLYDLVTIVSAIWFKVMGSVLTASFASFLYVLVYVTSSPDPLSAVQASLTLHIPFLYLVALLSGYVAEAQEWERNRRIETQLLLSDYEREMSMSRDIQKLLLPGHLPEVEGVEVSAMTRLARIVGGGDYYDLIRLNDAKFGVCVADVAGKSIRAQIRLPLLKYALRAVSPIYHNAAAVVTHLNAMVYEDLQPDMFIAICYALFDLRSDTVELCIAGHPPPLHCAQTNPRCYLLPAGGIPLGVDDKAEYETVTLPWKPGDVLVFYTDGVNHARNGEGEEFGEERLGEALQRSRWLSTSSLAEALLRRVDEFESGERSDDLTILVVKRNH